MKNLNQNKDVEVVVNVEGAAQVEGAQTEGIQDNSQNEQQTVQDTQAVQGAAQPEQPAQPAAKPARRISNHVFHPNCQELIALLEKVDVNTTTIYRGHKVLQEVNLITDKERELLETFQSTDYNIKRTGDVLGFSHTNVWQRLYGNGKKAKGILGKLREYVDGKYITELPAQLEAPTAPAAATAPEATTIVVTVDGESKNEGEQAAV